MIPYSVRFWRSALMAQVAGGDGVVLLHEM
jgi:hypothetical protein